MQVIYPTEIGVSGIYLVGYRRGLLSGSAQQVGSIIIKRSYRIVDGKLEPVADPIGIRTMDEQQQLAFGGEIFSMTIFESDLIVYKPRADLIVRGSYVSSNSYVAKVIQSGDEQIWLQRPVASLANPITDADAAHNIFGWEQRWFDARKNIGIVPVSEPVTAVPDYSSFNNAYFNAYRRIFKQGGFPSQQFQHDATISIERTPDGEGAAIEVSRFSLGNEEISARLYLYEGKGKDAKKFWCCQKLNNFHLDTLVITPGDNEVYAVWRNVWDFNQYPQSSYRLLSVSVEEQN